MTKRGRPSLFPSVLAGDVESAQLLRLLLFLTLLGCFGYFFPRWADWNQNSRFNLVQALVDDGTVKIDRYVGNTGDYAYIGGHYYSDKAPGMAVLGVPVYAAVRSLIPTLRGGSLPAAAADNDALRATLRVGGSGLSSEKLSYFFALTVTTSLTVALPSALLGVLFFDVSGHLGLSRRQRLLATLLYGLATPAFAYANAFVGHQTAAFLLFAAFAVLFGIRRGALPRAWLPAAGFLIGYAAITEYPTALIGGLLGLYALLTLGQPRDTLVRLTIGLLPPLFILIVYDLVAFGTPLPVGYLHSTLWTDVHQTGFVSLTYPRPEALWGITFSPHRGLFFLSPFLLWALPGYAALWTNRARRPEFWLLLLAPLALLLFNGSSVMWSGGFAVGPRYLVPMLPFLALAAAAGLGHTWPNPAARLLALAAGAWSLFAVWSETVAGQSFPDYTPNPLFDLSLPRLVAGDIARNTGMILGLSGWASLAPLLVGMLVALVLFALLLRSRGATPIARPRAVTGTIARTSTG